MMEYFHLESHHGGTFIAGAVPMQQRWATVFAKMDKADKAFATSDVQEAPLFQQKFNVDGRAPREANGPTNIVSIPAV